MANICLLTDNISHNAATSCRDALVAGGHTVTMSGADSEYDLNNVVDFSQFDLVVTSRTENAARANLATKLNELNNAGMPIILGPGLSGVYAGESRLLPTEMDLTTNLIVSSTIQQISITDNQHAITQGIALGDHAIFSVDNYLGAVSSSYIGTSLATANVSTDPLPAIIAMEVGTPRLSEGAAPLGARIVMFPTYLISGAYTTLHQTLLNQAVDWALAGEGAYEPPPPPEQVEASKLVGYAVMGFPEGHVGNSKLTAYAVMDLEHAQVYSSKLVAYAVMYGEYVAPEPIEPRVGDTLGHQGDVWENNPTSFLNQWQRNQADISGATNPTYLLVPADEGTMIRNRLIGVNEFGQSDPVFSAEVGPILPGEGIQYMDPDVDFNLVMLLSGFDTQTGVYWFDESSYNREMRISTGHVADTSIKKFGNSSVRIPPSTSAVYVLESSAFNLGDNDFTIEAWIRREVTTIGYLCGKWGTNATVSYGLRISEGVITWRQWGASGETPHSTPALSIPVNEWHHVCVERSGTKLRIYLNGACVYIGTASAIRDNTENLFIGGINSLSNDWAGWIDEFRFVKGAAVYNSDDGLILPTGPFARS